MEYVYASLILHAAGKEINEENIASILDAAGVKANPAQAKSIVAALEGVNIDDAIKSAALPMAAPSAAAPAAKEAKKEEKKEEKEEKKEEVAGLGALFG